MAGFHRVLAVCILCVVLVPWGNVVALDAAISPNATSMHHSMTVTPTLKPTVNHSMTVTPTLNASSMHHNMTVTPTRKASSMHHNMTVTPSRNASSMHHNMTVTPSRNASSMHHNMTVTPSRNASSMHHNMTVTPSHNMTVTPMRNSTVMPPHNMTITPSSAHSSVMPTSSAHPTLPPPKQGNFSVKYPNGSKCLFADMAVVFGVSYMTKNSSKQVTVDLPTNAEVTGKCESPSNGSSITLKWPPKKNLFMFTIHFSKGVKVGETKAGAWEMDNVALMINTTNNPQFPGANETSISFAYKKQTQPPLKGEVGKAYMCRAGNLKVKLASSHNETASIGFSHFEFQPFGVNNGTLSNDVQHCPADNPATTAGPPTKPMTKKDSKVVAIAVGCSLAGLVIIVLIGYLIGRRRSRSQAGYRKL